MASYSSGIQLDVDSISLSPSEIRNAILNDGTEFSGSDIDAPISSAGTDWSSKTPKCGGSSLYNADPNKDIVSVSGSGFLIAVAISATDGNNDLRIDIDGNTIDNLRLSSRGTVEQNSNDEVDFSLTLFHRFNTGFAVGTGSFTTSNSIVSGTVSYVLD